MLSVVLDSQLKTFKGKVYIDMVPSSKGSSHHLT